MNGEAEHTDDMISGRWHDLGFVTDLKDIRADSHYCAVRSDTVREDLSSEDVGFSGSVRDGKTIYSFMIDTSVMMPEFWTYSMKVDGNECGRPDQGLNIVVYDNDLKRIIDKVNIDLTGENRNLTRY